MGRPHVTRWTQVSLLHESPPPRSELPPDIRAEAIRILADLLLTHLGVVVTPEAHHESEDHS